MLCGSVRAVSNCEFSIRSHFEDSWKDNSSSFVTDENIARTSSSSVSGYSCVNFLGGVE